MKKILDLTKDVLFLQRSIVVVFIFLCLVSISKCSTTKKLLIKTIQIDSCKNDIKALSDSIKYLTLKIEDTKSFKSENVEDILKACDKKLSIKDKEISGLKLIIKQHK